MGEESEVKKMRISELPDDFKPEPTSEKVLQLKNFIEKELKGKIDYVFNDEILGNAGMYLIIFDREMNEFSIGFHVNTDPGDAACIFKEISAFLSVKGINIILKESIAFEFDKNGVFSCLSTGLDAYYTVGRKPFCGDRHIANMVFQTKDGILQDI